MSSFYRWRDEDLLLFCHLQPKASRDEFCGEHGGRLKVRIQAPPVEGKANQQLIRFVAKAFGVAKQAVEITSGEQSRQKNLCIHQPQQLPATLKIKAREDCH